MVLHLKSISVLAALSLSLFFVLRNEISVSDILALVDGTIEQQNSSGRRLNTAGVAPRTVALTINTPKTGTGGLSLSLARSLPDCVHQDTSTKQVAYDRCGSQSHAIRSHDFEPAAEVMMQIRSEQPIDQCLVVSAIRNPQYWIPSVFMEANKNQLCDAILTPSELQAKYAEWLGKSKRHLEDYVTGALPPLLAHFGASSMTDEFQKVIANGGYTTLTNAPTDGPFAGCTLLFLQVEKSHLWPKLVASELPGMKYEKPVGRDRADLCPNIAAGYASLGKYELGKSERLALADGMPGLTEYFRLYGYI